MFYSFTILTLHHGEIKSGISRGWRETGERMACFWADCTNPTPQQERQNVKKRTPCVRLLHDRVYKPGSVSDSHLSSRRVAAAIQPPPRKQPGQPCFLHGVAPDRVCSDGRFHAIGCALTAPFHPYRIGKPIRRYISVALFLKSPSAGVTRYPCPGEPGLSSCAAVGRCARDCPTRSPVYFTLF